MPTTASAALVDVLQAKMMYRALLSLALRLLEQRREIVLRVVTRE